MFAVAFPLPRRDNSPMAIHPIAGNVEIKVNVSGIGADRAVENLGFARRDAKARQIWFYEHVRGINGRGAIPLFRNNAILRVRRKPGGEGDVTVKLRGKDLVLPDAWGEPGEGDGWTFKIEGDWTGQRRTTAASLSVDVDDLDGGDDAPELALVTDRQLDLLHTSLDLPIDVDALTGLGPIEARTWSATKIGFHEKVAAEHWRVGSLEFFELSLRVDAADAPAVQQAFDEFLSTRVNVSDMAATKTETVLRHFSEGAPG